MTNTLAGTYDIIVEQGDDHTEQFEYVDNEGTPIPLTGFEAKLQVRQHRLIKNKTPVLLTWSSEGATPEITIDEAAGIITIEVSSAATRAITFSEGEYDLLLIDGDTVERLVEGKFTVKPSITDLE